MKLKFDEQATACPDCGEPVFIARRPPRSKPEVALLGGASEASFNARSRMGVIVEVVTAATRK